MKAPKVLISILNWNAPKNTCETVKSVLLSEYANYTILVIDNNSIDDSVIRMKEFFPGITVWALNENIGYAGAHKKAAAYAIENNYDLLWILNNDVVVYSFTLKELVLAYERNSNSLFGSVSLEPDGETIHFGGGATLIDNYTIDKTEKYNSHAGRNFFKTNLIEMPVSDIEGASFLIPVEIIKKHRTKREKDGHYT